MPAGTEDYVECAEEQLTLREHLTFAFWGVYHWFDWRVRGMRCLMTRHDIVIDGGYEGGYYYGEPDWCRRCWRSDPNEERTLWNVANNSYVWLVEHWLPSWWKY